MFQYFNKNSIRRQESHDLFSYNIGYGEKDFSLSADVNAYCFSKTGSASASYASIKSAFYSDQSLTSGYIIPTSFYTSKVGDQSVSSLLIFSFDSLISRDGISNINESKNIEIELSSLFVDGSGGNVYPKGNAANQKYKIFDKRDTSSSGTMYISIVKNSLISTTASDFNYSANDIPIGRIFYEHSLIILDSLTKLNVAKDVSNNYNLIPYPIISTDALDFSLTDLTTGIIPTNPNGGDIASIGYSTSTGVNGSGVSIAIIINTIKVNFKMKKDLNYITVDLPKDKLLFTTNRTKGENSKLYASEDSVNWLSKVGFYDLEGNLLAIGKLSKPIKKTNERDVKLTFKMDS